MSFVSACQPALFMCSPLAALSPVFDDCTRLWGPGQQARGKKNAELHNLVS